MLIEDLYKLFQENPVVCTDTRKITRGCLFFALKGDNFDGNAFAAAALEQGASYAIIDDESYSGDRAVLVTNVLQTLQQLANYHRKQLSIPFIGITGSNGKTTTKELIKSVLSVKYNVYATIGNLNNHIGVPLTLLSIDSSIEIAIIEMGANHQREIADLCAIAEPKYGVITNVGHAHLEGFGGFEGVKKGKGELYDHLKKTSGKAFINQDNDLLRSMAEDRQLSDVFWYSINTKSPVKGELVENDPFLTIDWIAEERHRVKTQLTGPYNLENILAAISFGYHFGLTAEEINKGLESYNPGNNRSQISKTERNTLICDYYNANPSSMVAALDNFATLSGENKIIILGDMFELGESSEPEHLNIIEKASSLKDAQKIYIGKNFRNAKPTEDESLYFEATADAINFLNANKPNNATILIKGSRGMQLEKLVNLL